MHINEALDWNVFVYFIIFKHLLFGFTAGHGLKKIVFILFSNVS